MVIMTSHGSAYHLLIIEAILILILFDFKTIIFLRVYNKLLTPGVMFAKYYMTFASSLAD